jgi:pyruvate ferredoxin oxidoreductase delta subunit
MELKIGAIIENPGNSLKNKRAGWRSFRPIWDNKKCTQCGLCWMYCPDNAIYIKDKKRSKTNLDYCKGCCICASVCKFNAIQIVKEK